MNGPNSERVDEIMEAIDAIEAQSQDVAAACLVWVARDIARNADDPAHALGVAVHDSNAFLHVVRALWAEKHGDWEEPDSTSVQAHVDRIARRVESFGKQGEN